MIAIIDYDIGNVMAIVTMLSRLGVIGEVTSNPEQIECASHIILPGNGSFDACMSGLMATGLIPLLERRVLHQQVPFLGICVGAQMLGRGSQEGRLPGLNWLPMDVVRFPNTAGLPVPHMGWAKVMPTKRNHALVSNMGDDERFYFVHSYYLAPDDSRDVLLQSEYGIRFASAVARDNIVGIQFHPEKSHRFGKQLLANFVGGQQ